MALLRKQFAGDFRRFPIFGTERNDFMEKTKIAVIGYGGQGKWHCGQLLKSDVAELAGVYDIDPVKQQQIREAGIRCYDSFEEVLADESVQAVTVVTPNDCHKELVIRSLEAGKNVICEKPVEMSVAAFDEMADAAKKSGKLFTVHQNRRWDVDFLAMKKIAHSGEIGDLLNIESRVHGSRGIPSDWRCHKQYGGGMMLDWGVHMIDQLLQITGSENKIVRIWCETTHYTNDEVDDGFNLRIFFANGAKACIELGTYNFLPLPRFYMQCKNGTAEIVDWRENAKIAKLKAWNEKDVLPEQMASGVTKTMAARDDITLDVYEADRPVSDVHEFYRNFCKAIRGEAEPLIKLPEVRRVLQVMEAAFASADAHQSVETNI